MTDSSNVHHSGDDNIDGEEQRNDNKNNLKEQEREDDDFLHFQLFQENLEIIENAIADADSYLNYFTECY